MLLCPNCHAEEHYLKASWLTREMSIESEGCSER